MNPLELLAHWGLAVVFVAVLLEQAGLPVPAAPLLVAAGSLADTGLLRAELVLLAALAACVIADHLWFAAGRTRGRALLAGICRLSLSPDTCVRRTDDLIARHGAPLLLVAKFIPGVSAVSIPTAAAMGIPYRRFLGFDTLGALAWCGVYVGAGMIFSREVQKLIDGMAGIGGWSLAVLGVLLALYVGLKAAYRARLKRLYRAVRISPEEAVELLDGEPDVVFVDARTALARDSDARQLPNAVVFRGESVARLLPAELRDHIIVTFCTCPNEASAAWLADELLKAGFTRVRVLTGGSDALGLLARPPGFT
jgi:membrane protein DedA with SNARE-associated domain/rhodanese-related sulfurtransferase